MTMYARHVNYLTLLDMRTHVPNFVSSQLEGSYVGDLTVVWWCLTGSSLSFRKEVLTRQEMETSPSGDVLAETFLPNRQTGLSRAGSVTGWMFRVTVVLQRVSDVRRAAGSA